jgi:hypothetical protein
MILGRLDGESSRGFLVASRPLEKTNHATMRGSWTIYCANCFLPATVPLGLSWCSLTQLHTWWKQQNRWKYSTRKCFMFSASCMDCTGSPSKYVRHFLISTVWFRRCDNTEIRNEEPVTCGFAGNAGLDNGHDCERTWQRWKSRERENGTGVVEE